MTYKQWLRNTFGPRVQASRASRRGRNSFKLMLEILEDRLTPTVSLGYDSTTGTLTVSAGYNGLDTGSPTLIKAYTDSTTNQLAIFTNDDTMAWSGTAPAGFTLSGTPFLPNTTLTTTNTINNLTITDSTNTAFVDLYPLGLAGNVSVSGAGTMYLEGAVAVLGSLTMSAKTINFDSGAVVQVVGNLTASATTINFLGSPYAQVEDFATASLTSVNSLTFQSTGVPYLGPVKINNGPPSGQPFAGDPYITGPDWGSYGYAPGDTIFLTNAGTLSSGPYYTVDAIVGDNLYLDSTYNSQFTTYLSPNLSKNLTDVTVQCSGFTPEIAAATLNLAVTGAGNTISGAISGTGNGGGFGVLNAATVDGNITIQDLPSTGTTLVLGRLNAGTGTIQLAVTGSVVSGEELNFIYEAEGDFEYDSYYNAVNLTAGAVDLTTTGSDSGIGDARPSEGLYFPIVTQSGEPGQNLELTAATNDGSVYIADSSQAGLTINSVVADQGGQAPIVSDGQIVYNSTPNLSIPTYNLAGTDDVEIGSTGPIVLNSVSATDDVDITGEYIVEGNAQSPNIIAQSVELVATGTADYQGQVAFADSATGDTLTLPAGGNNWNYFGISDSMAGDPIIVSGAIASANDGVFTIGSVSGNILTLTQSFVLTPETQAGVTVGDGIIGQASAAIALSAVPLFSATTSNGSIYLEPGNAVDSTAVSVVAGSMLGMANDVSVTSQATFLTIESIDAAMGEAAVTENSGSLLEYNGGLVSGQTVSLTSPFNIGTASSPFQTDATNGLTVSATAATSPSSAGIYIDNIATSSLTSVGVSTFDGSVTIMSDAGLLSFNNNVLSETGAAVVTFANMDDDDGSAGNVVVSGTVYVSGISAGIGADGTAGSGQILTNPTGSGTINGNGGTVILSAGSGIGVPGTPVNITNVTTLDATTNTGSVEVTNGTSSASTLTLSASTSAGNIDVTWNGSIDLSSGTSNAAGVVLDSISAPGTVTLDAVGGDILDELDSGLSANTLILTATNGIGAASSLLEISSRGTLTLTATAGDGLFLDSNTALTVQSATAGGDLSISASGDLTLQGNVSGANATLTATAGTVTATAGTVTATTGALTITAQQIGSTSDVIQTNATSINATANYGGIYLSNDNSNPLTLTAAAVGTSSGLTANNIEIFSAGRIVLLQQTTALTQLATSVPIALFSPGGALTLFAGETLSADGNTPTVVNSSATIVSATPPATTTSKVNASNQVASVSVTNGSSGYTTAPTVTFSGGGGSGATATATIDANGQVTGITVTNGGSGYTSAPTVTLSPPGDDIYTGTYDINGTTSVSSSSPQYLQLLVIVSNTAEVIPPGQGGTSGIPALITLADLTALAAQTNGSGLVPLAFGTETVATTNGATTVTIVAGAITIDDLGQNGSSGTAIIPDGWSLVLDATDGSIVFLNLEDTIATAGTGTITVEAGTSATDVAALGNLTTGGGNITVSAGGNIALGTLTAGKTVGSLGAISVTSANGAILFSTATTPTVTASSTTLTLAAQPVYSTQSAALAQLYATEVIAAAAAASAQAVSAADAAGAQAAAELVTVNALQAALTSIHAAVTTANQNYQTDVQITNQDTNTMNAQQNSVNGVLEAVTVLDGIAGTAGLLSAIQGEITAFFGLIAAPEVQVPVLGTVLTVSEATSNFITATFGLISAVAGEAAYVAQIAVNNTLNDLANDVSVLAADQANQAQAAAELQADSDTETALTAAFDVAEQAYNSSEQAYTNDQATSVQVQAQGANAQAIAIAGVVFAAPSQPLTATATGSGPVTIRALSPLTVSSNTTAVAAINLTAQPEGPSTTPGDDLTVNTGVTVQSTGSSVTLLAGDNVDVESGSTIEADSTIAITANGNDDPNGATVTVAGALTAQSASIGVDPGATGNETFVITPSPTTPISVDGGSDSSGANTLNFNAEGLPVTISGDTITAGTLAPVTFTNIEVVNITNEAGSSFSVSDGGIYNGKAFSATLQVSGAANLQNITPTLTYYRGNQVSPAFKLSGAPINAGAYTVIASFANNTYATALALRTFTIDPLAVILTGSRSYDWSAGASSSILTVSNAISPDTVDVASGTGMLASKNAGAQSITSFGTLALGNNAAGDYTLTGATGTVTINPETPNEIYVGSIYLLLLNRVPDPGALGWANDLKSGMAPSAVVQAIEQTTEYRNDVVNGLYLHYLKRAADPTGLQRWTGLLAGGGTIEQVIDGLVSSPEYFALQGNSNSGFVKGLYQDILGRTGSPGEVQGWVNALSGVTGAQVAMTFLTSQEYRINLVDSYYLEFLRRPADSAGKAVMVDALAEMTDQEVLARIFGSPEGYALWS